MRTLKITAIFICIALLFISVVNLAAETEQATYNPETQIIINIDDIVVPMPSIVVPVINVPSVEVPEVDAVAVEEVKIDEVEVDIPEVTEVNVYTPEVPDINKSISRLVSIKKKLLTLVHDTRSIAYDKTITSNNTSIDKWIAIYENWSQEPPYEIAYVRLKNKLRMIAEARVPKTGVERQTQIDNLDWYREKGYNACLLCIYMDEDMSDLVALVSEIKRRGYDLYIAYSGIESLDTTVFIDPDIINRYISRIAPMARGFVLGWRKTSVHLFIQDPAFTNYLIKCARTANPNIELLGEGYYGQTADSNERTNVVTYNMPENASGCMLIGVGYRNVNASGVLNGLFKSVPRHKQIPVILGDNAYYKTSHNNGLSFEENFNIKLEIENKFLKAWVPGTITFHGDGRSETTDCLTSPRN